MVIPVLAIAVEKPHVGCHRAPPAVFLTQSVREPKNLHQRVIILIKNPSIGGFLCRIIRNINVLTNEKYVLKLPR